MQKTIDITTTQNVTIEYELATLRERLLAWVLDFLLVCFGAFILMQLVQALFGQMGEVALTLIMIVFTVGFFLYFIFFEIWNAGQTPGKKVLGIKVVRLDGKEPEWGDVVLRAILYLMDAFLSLGVLGSVLIKTSPKAQRMGDMAANTTIIKLLSTQYQYRLEDILNISSLQNYTPVYPQVRVLTEQDLIFIKTVLTRHGQYPNQAHEEVIIDLVTHLMPLLGLDRTPANRIDFLKTLLRDYVVLTR
jgi:uncharacterized RDD family membrane protein YckC